MAQGGHDPTARERLRRDAAAIFSAAVAAVHPDKILEPVLFAEGDRLRVRPPSGGPDVELRFPVTVVGAGKAAARMARAVERIAGADRVHGVVVAPVADASGSVEVLAGGHPVPNESGVAATHRLSEVVREADAPVLVLVSGGASSLLVAPRTPVTLADKVAVNRLLLASGCSIDELNCVRKHLSVVKGGGLLRLARHGTVALVLSDVVGDDLATIASGPTVADPTTFADAESVLRRYVRMEEVPESVREVLRRGVSGEISETVKPEDRVAERAQTFLVGSNRQALDAAAVEARARGWHPRIAPEPVVGEARQAARRFAGRWLGARGVHRGECVLSGGETTVTVHGDGRGGRNQEFALALAEDLAGRQLGLLSAGTDGIDGPTDAAGAFVDGTTVDRAVALGLSGAESLRRNDSYGYFAALGDLLVTGATGTNVADLQVLLCGGA